MLQKLYGSILAKLMAYISRGKNLSLSQKNPLTKIIPDFLPSKIV